MGLMEHILSGLTLAGLIAAAWMVFQLSRHQVVRANLRALAGRHKGRFHSFGALGPHEVWFRRAEAAVHVVDAPGGDGCGRRLHLGFVQPRAEPVCFRLRLRSWGSRVLLWLRRIAGARTAADADFERRFLIEGDPAQVAGVFGPTVRSAVDRLHELCGRRDLRIEADESGLYLTVPVSTYFVDDLNGVLDAACRLHDLLDAAGDGAVPAGSLHIVESLSRVPGAGDSEGLPRCPVCATADGGEWVTCRQCGTPHHRDCWTYNESCAVYGCRGRRRRRAG
jgi:hypothetical protein